MKRSVTTRTIPEYIDALFKDIAYMYARRPQWDRDRSRALHELEHRGLRMLTIDLPDLCKHFDWCLDVGQYTPSQRYLGKAAKGMQVPVFLRDLHLLVFDGTGDLREDPDPNAVAAIRQIYKGFAKVRLPCKKERVNDEVRNFHRIESSLRSPTLHWVGDRLGDDGDFHAIRDPFDRFSYGSVAAARRDDEELDMFGSRDDRTGLLLEPRLSRILSNVTDRISSQFGTFDTDGHSTLDGVTKGFSGIPELPKHSAGRVSDIPKRVSKYTFPHWPQKLDLTFPMETYGALNSSSFVSSSPGRYSSHEPPSKLCAVPKTQKGPRLIASEPTCHQWVQQLLWRQIQVRMPRTVLRNCIDFHSQSANMQLAKEGSIKCNYVTVDLSSASDRLSCWTLERMFIANISFLKRLHACRTRWVRNAINPLLWDHISLKKGFSQGNACTFPVQSIVYSIFAIAAVIDSRDWPVTSNYIERASRVVRVFGDDIIVPDYALACLRTILEANQLQVNELKTYFGSHTKGSFRESCGGEYFRGHDVTPKYIKTIGEDLRHEKAVSAIEASNNLHEAGWWNAAKWQLSLVSRAISRNLPITDFRGASLSIFSFSGVKVDHLKSRWNSDLQREEVQTYVLTSKSRHGPMERDDRLFQRLAEATAPKGALDYLNPAPVIEAGPIIENSSILRRGWF